MNSTTPLDDEGQVPPQPNTTGAHAGRVPLYETRPLIGSKRPVPGRDAHIFQYGKARKFMSEDTAGPLMLPSSEGTVDDVTHPNGQPIGVHGGQTLAGSEPAQPRRILNLRVQRRLVPSDPSIAANAPIARTSAFQYDGVESRGDFTGASDANLPPTSLAVSRPSLTPVQDGGELDVSSGVIIRHQDERQRRAPSESIIQPQPALSLISSPSEVDAVPAQAYTKRGVRSEDTHLSSDRPPDGASAEASHMNSATYDSSAGRGRYVPGGGVEVYGASEGRSDGAIVSDQAPANTSVPSGASEGRSDGATVPHQAPANTSVQSGASGSPLDPRLLEAIRMIYWHESNENITTEQAAVSWRIMSEAQRAYAYDVCTRVFADMHAQHPKMPYQTQNDRQRGPPAAHQSQLQGQILGWQHPQEASAPQETLYSQVGHPPQPERPQPPRPQPAPRPQQARPQPAHPPSHPQPAYPQPTVTDAQQDYLQPTHHQQAQSQPAHSPTHKQQAQDGPAHSQPARPVPAYPQSADTQSAPRIPRVTPVSHRTVALDDVFDTAVSQSYGSTFSFEEVGLDRLEEAASHDTHGHLQPDADRHVQQELSAEAKAPKGKAKKVKAPRVSAAKINASRVKAMKTKTYKAVRKLNKGKARAMDVADEEDRNEDVDTNEDVDVNEDDGDSDDSNEGDGTESDISEASTIQLRRKPTYEEQSRGDEAGHVNPDVSLLLLHKLEAVVGVVQNFVDVVKESTEKNQSFQERMADELKAIRDYVGDSGRHTAASRSTVSTPAKMTKSTPTKGSDRKVAKCIARVRGQVIEDEEDDDYSIFKERVRHHLRTLLRCDDMSLLPQRFVELPDLKCDEFPCPNRYDQVGELSNNWAAAPHPSQVSAPSSEALHHFEPPSPAPFSLEFLNDFDDSPQFYLLTMGDVKLDSVPILSSANQYADWSAKMKGYLMFMNCWTVVAGTITRPTAAGDSQKEWDKLNAQACGLMYMRTSPTFHYLLETRTVVAADGTTTTQAAVLTSNEMWDALKAKFGKPNSAHVWGLFESLISETRMSDQRSLQDQMSRVITRLREISTNGITLSETIQALFSSPRSRNLPFDDFCAMAH
ncbi:hypothetical protein BD414DRAFT_541107 [Trametes punicea]|nr:hypothetical protein BD414DRAFT_541107 [Trametes punicea]